MKSTFKRLKRRLLGQRDRVRLVGRHYEHARRLLLLTVDWFNAAAINYHVVYGTLLGLARDRDLIPWDVDVDVMIGRDDLPRVRSLLPAFRRAGWRVCDRYPMADDTPAWRRGDTSSIMVRRPLLADLFRSPYLRTGRKIMDLYVRYPDGDCQAWDTFDRASRAPQYFFDAHDTIEFAGRQVHVPRDYRAFLELIYGDWRTPNPQYDAHRDDGSLRYRSAA